MLRRISTVAREISGADAASLYIYDERTDSFTRAYASRRHRRLESVPPAQHRHDPPRDQRRQARAGEDTHTHPEVNPHTIEAGIGSLIAVPLISQGQPVGVMYVGSFKMRQFDEDDVQIVSALANQAAVAISNARLFSEIAESRDQLQGHSRQCRRRPVDLRAGQPHRHGQPVPGNDVEYAARLAERSAPERSARSTRRWQLPRNWAIRRDDLRQLAGALEHWQRVDVEQAHLHAARSYRPRVTWNAPACQCWTRSEYPSAG